MYKATIEDKRKFVHLAQVKFHSQRIFLDQIPQYKRIIVLLTKISKF